MVTPQWIELLKKRGGEYGTRQDNRRYKGTTYLLCSRSISLLRRKNGREKRRKILNCIKMKVMNSASIGINTAIGITSLILLFSVLWLGMIILSKQKNNLDNYVYGIDRIFI